MVAETISAKGAGDFGGVLEGVDELKEEEDQGSARASVWISTALAALKDPRAI